MEFWVSPCSSNGNWIVQNVLFDQQITSWYWDGMSSWRNYRDMIRKNHWCIAKFWIILTEHWVLATHIIITRTRATTSPQKHWILNGTVSVHLFLCQFSLLLHESTTHVSQVFAFFLSWHGCVKHQPFANVRDFFFARFFCQRAKVTGGALQSAK